MNIQWKIDKRWKFEQSQVICSKAMVFQRLRNSEQNLHSCKLNIFRLHLSHYSTQVYFDDIDMTENFNSGTH